MLTKYYNEVYIQNTYPLAAQSYNRAKTEKAGNFLEIGCGSGLAATHVAATLLKPKSFLCALDYAKLMVDDAKCNFEKSNFLKLPGSAFEHIDPETGKIYRVDDLNKGDHDVKCVLMQADGQNPPFADESFDGIISVYAVMNMSNPQMFFDNIYRLLKPGGKAVVVAVGSSSSLDKYKEAYQACAEAGIRMTDDDVDTISLASDPQLVNKTLATAGFKNYMTYVQEVPEPLIGLHLKLALSNMPEEKHAETV